MKLRTEARREAIVQEATRLFMELGYERATMGELASRLGGSKATLYGYFHSKEELFAAVAEATGQAHLSEALAELQLLPVIGVEEGLTRFAQCMLTLMHKDDALALHRMIVGEAGRSDVGDLFLGLGPRHCMEAVRDALQAAIDRGDMQPASASVLTQQFLGLVRAEGEMRLYMRHPPRLTREEVAAMARRAVRMFLGGYRYVAAADADASASVVSRSVRATAVHPQAT